MQFSSVESDLPSCIREYTEISPPSCVRTREAEKRAHAKKLPESPHSKCAFHKAQGQGKQSSMRFRRTFMSDKTACVPTRGNDKQTGWRWPGG